MRINPRPPIGLLILLAIGIGPMSMPASGQTPSEVLDAARELVLAVRFCALITLDAEGKPQARAMDPFPPSEEFTVWLGTHRGTRKVEQIRRNARVTLYYFSDDPPGYVTLIGTARLVDDLRARQEHWKEEWSAFYEDDYRGNDFLLIEVVPQRLEVVSHQRGIATDPKAWKPAVVEFP